MPRLFLILLMMIPLLSFAEQENFQYLNEKGLFSKVSILEDKSGDKTLADILAMQDSFKPAEHVFSGGFTQSVYWFQVTVQRAEYAVKDWVLFAKPQTLHNLSFYALKNNGLYEFQQVGSLFSSPVRAIDKQLGGYSFKLNLKDTTPQVFYLRLQSRSTALLEISVDSVAKLSLQNTNRKLSLGVLFGALLMVTINIVLMWRQVNYQFYIAFIGYIVASIMHIMMQEGGFLDDFLPNYSRISSLIQDISFCSFVIFKTIFFVLYFDTKKYYPAVHVYFLVFIATVFLAILAVPFDSFTLIAPVVIVFMLITSIVQLYIASLSRCSNSPEGYYVFVGFALYFIVFIITLVVAAGGMWVDPVGILSARLALFALFIFIGLHINFQNLQKEQQVTKQGKEKAESLVKTEKQRNEDRSNFLNLVAHEIKTPLATIDSAIQVIEAHSYNESEVVQERHHRVRVSVRKLNNLLENILAAERDENLPFQVSSKLVALKKLIQHLVVEQVSATQQIVVKIESDLECRADSNLLNLALSNLLKNAIKYSPQYSTINLTAQKVTRIKTRGVFLSISNDYRAEQEANTKQWFDKYYKDEKNNNPESLGLGLFLVKRIIKVHNGHIDCVINQNGHYWRVTMNIWLPDKMLSKNND